MTSTKMNATTISNVNYYCLHEIFQQIKIKCEISLDWIRVQLYHWDMQLYRLLEIDKHFVYESELFIDFDIMYDGLRKSEKHDQNIFWKALIDNIKSKKHLRRIILKYTSGVYYEEHLELFDMILNALRQNKQSLKYFNIDVKGYTLETLPDFCNLEELHLNMRINADELIECCKSNPNLRKLSILNNEMYGKLADITRDPKSLQKVEKLDFRMKTEIDATEYAPFAKLPKLDHLRIRGEHEIGSLRQLLSDLAAKKTKRNLYRLSIDDAPMNDAESQAIAQIKPLRILKTKFTDAKNIGHLTQLPKLSKLQIKSEHSVPEMMDEILNIFKETQPPSIEISFTYGKIEYNKTVGNLTWIFNPKEIDAAEYAALGQIKNLSDMHIKGHSQKIGSLHNLFKEFASQMPQTLQNLRLSKGEFDSNNDDDVEILFDFLNLDEPEEKLSLALNREETTQLARIKSLQNLTCKFADLSNIDVLAQLPVLKCLTIIVPTNPKIEETEALGKFFQNLAFSPLPRLEFLDLSGTSLDLSLTKQMVEIKSLKKLHCSFSSDKCIELLCQLSQLEELNINSKHEFTNISQGILQILEISKRKIRIHLSLINSSITYDSSCKELEIHMYKYMNATSFGNLGNLENCHSLYISGRYKSGSLSALLKTFATKNIHSLMQLQIEDTEINYEESLLISKIETLEIILGTFCDPRSFEILNSLSNLRHIKFYESKFPSQILEFLNNYNEEITIENIGRTITFHKNLGKLMLINNSCVLEIFNASDYACLADLDNLQILHIYGHNEMSSLKTLFKELANLKPASILKELVIEETNDVLDPQVITINSVEALEISKILSLRKLKCGFSDDQNIDNLAQLEKLEELIITTHISGSLQGLLEKLSSRTTSALKVLSIENIQVTIDELKVIARIKSLETLDCIYITDNVESLPTFSNDAKISIRTQW